MSSGTVVRLKGYNIYTYVMHRVPFPLNVQMSTFSSLWITPNTDELKVVPQQVFYLVRGTRFNTPCSLSPGGGGSVREVVRRSLNLRGVCHKVSSRHVARVCWSITKQPGTAVLRLEERTRENDFHGRTNHLCEYRLKSSDET